MRFFHSFAALTLFLYQFSLCWAQAPQNYEPDTSLTYSTFLKQCQTFTQSVREEAWVVYFWDTNRSSLDYFTGLKEVYSEFRYKPIRFISISKHSNKSLWLNLLRRPALQPSWEQLRVPPGSDYDFLTKAFRHNSLPGIFIVNPQGQVQRVENTDKLRTVLTGIARTLPDRPYSSIASKDVSGPGEDPSNVSDNSQQTDITGNGSGAPLNGWVTHTVRKGETLYRLQVKYGVDVGEIKELNGLKTNNITVGEVLKIKRR